MDKEGRGHLSRSGNSLALTGSLGLLLPYNGLAYSVYIHLYGHILWAVGKGRLAGLEGHVLEGSE